MQIAGRATPVIRTDSLFFPAMAVALALSVFVGFSRSFYLKSVFHHPPPLSALMIVHGVVFTAWFLLLATQTALVAGNRRDIHRRLGVGGAVVATAMLVLGVALAVDALRRGFAPPGVPSPAAFFAIPIFDMLLFPILVGAALVLRARPDYHKRLMILASIAIVDASIARWPWHLVSQGGPPVFFGLADLFIVALLLYDLASRRRVHPATLWGGALLILSQPLRLILSATPGWQHFAAWLAG